MISPTDFLFTFLSTLTGGLITDLQTLLLGFVLIGFIVFGGQLIIGKLESTLASRTLGNAESYFELRNASGKGTFQYEYYNTLYHSEMSKALSTRQKLGGTFADSYIGLPASSQSEKSSSSSLSMDGFDTEFDALESEGSSLEELFPELAESSPARYADDPGPEYYGPPPEDEYYGPY